MARLGSAGFGLAGLGRARFGGAWLGEVRQGEAWKQSSQGRARLGEAWPGEGAVRLGPARQGRARPEAWFVAGLGKAGMASSSSGPGAAWQG